MTPARGKCFGVAAGLFGNGGRDGGSCFPETFPALCGLAGTSGMPKQLYSGDKRDGSTSSIVLDEHRAISFSTTSNQLLVFRARFRVALPI